MKNKTRYSLLLIALAFLTVVEGFSQNKATKTSITGQIFNPDKEYYMLRHRENLDTIWVDTEGKFAIDIKLNQPEECKIIVGKNTIRMYVLPGDIAYCEYSADKPNNPPVYSGKSGIYSQFFTEIAKNEMRYARNVHSKVLNPLSPARVLTVEDSILKLRIEFVEKYCTDNSLEVSFREYQIEGMKYLTLTELCNYRKTSSNYTADSLKSERPSFDSAINRLPIDNLKMLYSDFYQQFVRSYVSGNAMHSMTFDSPDDYPEYYNKQMDDCLRLLKNEEVRNYMIKEIAVEAMRESGTRDISGFIKKFEDNCTNQLMKTRVLNIWSTYAAIQPGGLCPPTECYDANGKNIMLSELKGKVIYIDIWATWCGPCKREIPMLKELEEEYHGKNVEFVSISTDKDIEAWKNFIVAQNLGGLQLHQSDNFDLSISKNFIVNSIPRFILIDANGKIVSSDAPRPSSGPTIRALLDKTLG